MIVLQSASTHFGKKFAQEQEIFNNLANMIMETYISESTELRVEKLEGIKGSEANALKKDILDVNIYDAAEKIRKNAYDAINSFASPANADKLIKAVNNLTAVAGLNVKDARRRIADKLIEDNAYKL